jgi:hypothetical protein
MDAMVWAIPQTVEAVHIRMACTIDDNVALHIVNHHTADVTIRNDTRRVAARLEMIESNGI